MSNKRLKPSSRYKGPAGDSRAPAEIFVGMEARAVENDAIQKELHTALDNALNSRKLASVDGRLELIRRTVVDWLFENDPTINYGEKGGVPNV